MPPPVLLAPTQPNIHHAAVANPSGLRMANNARRRQPQHRQARSRALSPLQQQQRDKQPSQMRQQPAHHLTLPPHADVGKPVLASPPPLPYPRPRR